MESKTLLEHAEELYALAAKETDPDIKASRIRVAEYYYVRHAAGSTEFNEVEIFMGDKITGDKISGGKYEISGQAGAVGPEAKAERNVFTQDTGSSAGKVDLSNLANELSRLADLLRQRTEDGQVVDKVQEAEEAASQDEPEKVTHALTGISGTPLSTAKELGTMNAFKAIRQSNLKIATAQELAHVTPWAQLAHEKYLVETKEIDAFVPTRVWQNLEEYGICLIRFHNYPPGQEVLENIVKLIGFPAGEQNDFSGAIKDINPAAEGRSNSGDTTSELGFHVDGTQDPVQPALLAFQYVRGAKLGANSRFADAAGVLADFAETDRNAILTTLARSDAATFSKLNIHYTGPIFSYSATNNLMCRVRFDSVISVHEECREAFELLRQKFESSYYPSMYLPMDGDIVVFDNWRVMHARDEIYGEIQRHHRRVWIELPRHEHQVSYQLGIRPVSDDVAARIREANNA